MIRYKSSLHRYTSCTRDCIAWNRITVENFSRFQSSRSRSKSSIYAKPRQMHAIWYMEPIWTTGKRFLAIHVLCSEHRRRLIKEFFTLQLQVLQIAIRVQVSTRRPVARGEERIGDMTTMSMSERRPSTMKSFLRAEVPQNSVVGQQRLQISELRYSPLHHRFVLEDNIQNPGKLLFRFSLGSYGMDQRSEMVDSVDELST